MKKCVNRFSNLKDLQNVIRDKWHDVDIMPFTIRKAIWQWKKRLAAVANTKFELMLTRCVKAYSSSCSVVLLKIGVFTLS